MKTSVYDSELKVMELLWEHGALTAKEIATRLAKEVDWKGTTTYTVLKKCVAKGLIQRSGDNYLCTPLFTREEIRAAETEILVDRLFNGRPEYLVASFLDRGLISKEELADLISLISEKEQ